MSDTIKYFTTYKEALEASKTIPLDLCVNQYQQKGDNQSPKVVSFKKGYAVQFGDCGDYLTK